MLPCSQSSPSCRPSPLIALLALKKNNKELISSCHTHACTHPLSHFLDPGCLKLFLAVNPSASHLSRVEQNMYIKEQGF